MKFNKKLSDILDIDKIEVVKNPIEKAHGLPNECYLNEDYLKFEKEKIFQNNWTMIGVASSVPNPGDIKDAVSACTECDDETSVTISCEAETAYSAYDAVPSREPVIPPLNVLLPV